jgi:hypothetical protein
MCLCNVQIDHEKIVAQYHERDLAVECPDFSVLDPAMYPMDQGYVMFIWPFSALDISADERWGIRMPIACWFGHCRQRTRCLI